MAHLLARKSKELSLYIKQHDVLSKVVNHIDTECVFNLLLTMLNTEATLESYLAQINDCSLRIFLVYFRQLNFDLTYGGRGIPMVTFAINRRYVRKIRHLRYFRSVGHRLASYLFRILAVQLSLKRKRWLSISGIRSH